MPSRISRNGGASEGYSFSQKGMKRLINKFDILKSKDSDIEMIDNFIKKLSFKSLKGFNYQIKNVRLTLDYEEDYKFFKKIREKLGNFAHRKKINYFLKKNVKIKKINFFRNKDWSNRQTKLIKKTQLS